MGFSKLKNLELCTHKMGVKLSKFPDMCVFDLSNLKFVWNLAIFGPTRESNRSKFCGMGVNFIEKIHPITVF